MLPPRLQEIKDRIEAKSASRRNSAEDELLNELVALDRSEEVRRLVRESRFFKVTSGPAGVCACCGK